MRVDSHGDVFRVTSQGEAAYIDRVVSCPSDHSPATAEQIEAFQVEHARMWKCVQDHLPLAKAVLWSVKGRVDDEVIHDVGIKCLMECARNYDPSKGVRFSTYAYRALVNRYVGVRNVSKTVPLDVDIEEEAVEHDCAEYVQWLVGRLPPEDKLLLELYYWKGFTMQELADVSGLGKSTICTRIKKAIERCRK